MLSYVSLFLLVFDLAIPPVKFIGSAPFSLLISLAYLSFNKLNVDITSQVKKFSIPFFLVYFLIVFFAMLRISFSGELNYLLSIMKSLVVFSATLFYLVAFGFKHISDKLINIFFINGVVCLVAGTIPEVLDIVYMFKSNVRELEFIPYRNAFLAGSGFFGLASAYAIIILLCARKIVKDGLSLEFAIKFMVILIAGILAGRTAFVGIMVSFVYIMSQSVKYSLLSSLLVAILVGIVFSVDSLSVYSDWMFEFISFDGDSVSLSRTSSTDHLGEMYFMPANDITWLWGDGRYVDGDSYYMNTDAGYMRNLFFGGLPFAMLVVFYACLFAIKSKSAFFVLFILPLVFALHYKGAFILNNPAGVPILTLLSFWFYNQKHLNSSLRYC